MPVSYSSPSAVSPRFILVGLVIVVASLALMNRSLGSPQGDQTEVNWLTDLARANDHNAQLQLGLAYREGRYGLSADAVKSDYWMNAAAQGGNAYAADLLANEYAGIAKTPAGEQAWAMDEALHWWRQAAREGNADAALQLGEYWLHRGRQHKAEAWLGEAADLGEHRAHQDLLVMYREGEVPVDDLYRGENALGVLAEEMHSTSMKSLLAVWRTLLASSTSAQSAEALNSKARAGDPVAEFELAMRYRDGSWAVERDPEKAMQWLQRSAAAGNPVAKQSLLEMKNRRENAQLISLAVSPMDGTRI